MDDKPQGWAATYAAWFELSSVADRYHLRPPYPDQAIQRLAALVDPGARAVLDVGCGLGDLARPLAPLVDRVDAVDRSQAMVTNAQHMPGGSVENIRWMVDLVEEAPLRPPYGLVVCGDSIHWLNWEVALPLFARSLTPGGYLAVVQRHWLSESGLRDAVGPIYARHGANPDFMPLDPVEELQRRGLFERCEEFTTGAEPWRPTTDQLVDCHHSQNGFTLEKMSDPDGFARELTGALMDCGRLGADGRFDLTVHATITWGRPLAP
jgi:SAM-dependent methyltransferase